MNYTDTVIAHPSAFSMQVNLRNNPNLDVCLRSDDDATVAFKTV